jgi:hypothetical protein
MGKRKKRTRLEGFCHLLMNPIAVLSAQHTYSKIENHKNTASRVWSILFNISTNLINEIQMLRMSCVLLVVVRRRSAQSQQF